VKKYLIDTYIYLKAYPSTREETLNHPDGILVGDVNDHGTVLNLEKYRGILEPYKKYIIRQRNNTEKFITDDDTEFEFEEFIPKPITAEEVKKACAELDKIIGDTDL
jgi:hypothetical protein